MKKKRNKLSFFLKIPHQYNRYLGSFFWQAFCCLFRFSLKLFIRPWATR